MVDREIRSVSGTLPHYPGESGCMSILSQHTRKEYFIANTKVENKKKILYFLMDGA